MWVLDRVVSSDSKSLSLDDRAWGYCKKLELGLAARAEGQGGVALEQALAAGE